MRPRNERLGLQNRVERDQRSRASTWLECAVFIEEKRNELWQRVRCPPKRKWAAKLSRKHQPVYVAEPARRQFAQQLDNLGGIFWRACSKAATAGEREEREVANEHLANGEDGGELVLRRTSALEQGYGLGNRLRCARDDVLPHGIV